MTVIPSIQLLVMTDYDVDLIIVVVGMYHLLDSPNGQGIYSLNGSWFGFILYSLLVLLRCVVSV